MLATAIVERMLEDALMIISYYHACTEKWSERRKRWGGGTVGDRLVLVNVVASVG
jgi:hypothetical protein